MMRGPPGSRARWRAGTRIRAPFMGSLMKRSAPSIPETFHRLPIRALRRKIFMQVILLPANELTTLMSAASLTSAPRHRSALRLDLSNALTRMKSAPVRRPHAIKRVPDLSQDSHSPTRVSVSVPTLRVTLIWLI